MTLLSVDTATPVAPATPVAAHPGADFAAFREAFPILRRQVQLSSCSQSALSIPVRQAVADYLDGWQHRGMDWGGWMQGVARAKAAFARRIGARPQDIAVMGSVSDLVSSIASALDFPVGRERVLMAESDFPSVGHVWAAQRRRGAELQLLPVDDSGWIAPERWAAALDARCAVLCVSHVGYAHGARQDLRGLSALARAQDALFLVDAYQSAGALDIDVARDGIDALVCGAQKFLLGTPGIAFAYVSPRWAARLQPAVTGWFGRVDPFAFDIRGLDWAEGAARLDTGTPAMLNAAAAAAGLELLQTLEPVAVEQRLLQLSAIGRQEAARLGLQVAGPAQPGRHGSTLPVRVAGAARLERALAERGVIVSARGDVLRVAPHAYTTDDELVGALRLLATLV